MWENAAQMRIVSLNWWQYAGRVWSHANNAQPPNSHLAQKIKINTAHWNNFLHIGGTWYCPSDPYTSSVCARLYRPEEPLHDEACSPCSLSGSAPFLAELQATPGGQRCLVQLRRKGVIHVSDPDWHLITNMLNWVHVWTPSWPVHDLSILLVPKGCRVTCCMVRWTGIHKVTSKHPRRPWQHLIPQDLDVPMFTSPMPVHDSIHYDQLTSPPMVDCTPYHDWRAMISIIRLNAGINQPLPAPGPDRHCGIGRNGTHHWRYSVSNDRGSHTPTLTAASPVL